MTRPDYFVYFEAGFRHDENYGVGAFIITEGVAGEEVGSDTIVRRESNSIRIFIECAIEALRNIPHGASVHFVTDLTYMVNIINHEWYIRANQDLWGKFENIARNGKHKCTSEWRAAKSRDMLLQRCWGECSKKANFDFVAYFENNPRK